MPPPITRIALFPAWGSPWFIGVILSFGFELNMIDLALIVIARHVIDGTELIG